MGFFNRSKSKPEAQKPGEEKEKQASGVARRTSGVVSDAATTPDARRPTHVLLAKPRVSEKAAILTSKGTYVFNVPVTAGKIEIRKAVEKQYKVNVTRVNTIRGEGKVVRRGKIEGRRANWKKALVTLKKGQKIELHAGV